MAGRKCVAENCRSRGDEDARIRQEQSKNTDHPGPNEDDGAQQMVKFFVKLCFLTIYALKYYYLTKIYAIFSSFVLIPIEWSMNA